jgi:hypothetical protein
VIAIVPPSGASRAKEGEMKLGAVRVATALTALVLVAGCGGGSSDTTSKFKAGYNSLRGPLNATGHDLAVELQQATNQTDAQVGAAFHSLATRFQSQLSQLETLKPPASVQAEWNTVSSAGNRLEADLNAVVAAAATHSKSAGEQAGASLATDAAALKAALLPIKAKFGLK